ncbi:hypothetical protein L226DRAFT_566239 [Lentinus tigrinus ALCF2SS1-7]|uniref:Uncharacterized protein n=1 Tax=Lentinus tigrinus ALCF2SS1-6 TaxID=1328759 RepID=A0A5C2T7F5_9APHY|nr:hypothetical protein L227DRAFT_569679 [Lentinus tigrinus ALCF2SS1-6]RPD81472.1 hypothetical protein L226DRAFT_566239 [Lentinus tigrinus ALCF2SS1-7]
MSTPSLIDDSAPIVAYSATGWIIDAGFLPAFNHTRHGATGTDASVSLTFEGTGIEVVTTRESTSRAGRPTTLYSIDGAYVENSTEPFVPDGPTQFNVTVFSKKNLPSGMHVLNISNLNGTSPNTYWIDYFLVYGSLPVTTEDRTTTVPSVTFHTTTRAHETSLQVAPGLPSTPTILGSHTTPPKSSQESSERSPSTIYSSRAPTAHPSRSPSATSITSDPAYASGTPYGASGYGYGIGGSSQTPPSPPASSVPSDDAAASRGTHHNIIPAVVGGVLGGIMVVSALVTLVLFIRRRNRLRHQAVEMSTNNRASYYFSNDGWVTLQSDNPSVEEDAADAARCEAAPVNRRPSSDSSQYASAFEHPVSEVPSELVQAWHAL